MGLLADYLPGLPTDPSQNSAARQGLLQFGAALLGGRGNFGSIMGQGLAAGAGGYNSALSALQKKALEDAQTRHFTLENDATQAAMDQDKAIREGLTQFNAQQPAPSAAAALVTGQSADPVPLSSTPQASPAPDAGLPLSMFPQSNAAPAQPVAPVSALPKVGAAPAAADPLADYKRAVAQYQYLNANYPGSKQAIAAQKAVETLAPKVKETKVVTLPGTNTRVLANIFENAAIPPQILRDVSPDAEKLVFGDDGGNRVGQNPFTGDVVSSIKKVATPGELLQSADQAKARVQAQAHWQAEQNGPDEPALNADAILNAAARYNVDGTLPPMGMGKAASAGRSAILNKAAELKYGIDPEQQRRDQLANKGDVAAQNAAVKAFTSGKQGNSVRSFNVSIAHLDTLDRLTDALGSKDTQVLNRIANAYAKQTGNAAPTSFEAVKHIVGDEIVKAVTGSAGALGDREAAAKTIDAINSPAQLKAVMANYKELMRGQLDGLRLQYETSTGRKDFDRYLTDAAKLSAHGGAAPKPTVKPVSALPKTKPAGVPDDIGALLNQYGRK